MTVKEIFETMDYGPAPESAGDALAWIVDQGAAFGNFIDGAWTAPRKDFQSKNPANGETLADLSQATQDEVNAAVKAARKAQPKWEGLGGHGRAKFLYAIARLLQKHSRLFAVLETLDNGKPIRESRDIDIPLVQRHFYYHAGMAQLMESELPNAQALGVCGQIVPWNFPLLMLAWKVAPALAMGNTVVLKPAEYTSLTALLFADICQQAGLPAGVVNIVTGDGAVGEMITAHEDINKVAFTGSTAVGRRIRETTAGTGKSLTLELGGKSAYIVFDDADIDSAIEGLVDAIWFNQGQVCCAGSRLLVQEGIAEQFHTKLKARMDGLRIGNPLDKCIDVGAVVDPVQLATISDMVAANTDGDTYQPALDMPAEGCFYPPTLITGLAPSSKLMQEEIFGPVLVSTTFRTPSEAVALANNTRYGLAATLWTENVNLALDIAPKLVAGVVWVNATNLFDAAAGFGGVRESGHGREGGWEGLSAYTKPKGSPKALKPVEAFTGDKGPLDPLDRTPKLYVGGKQARPDGGYSQNIYGKNGALLGQAPISNRKDVRNAVEAAHAAKGWSGTTGHLRAQILYYIAENLSARREEFANRVNALTGGKQGEKEVEASVRRLFTYAAWADKYDGQAHGVPIRGVALAMKEPVGVIGALCPDEHPLLGLISIMAPAIAMGNRVVLAASQTFPLAATDFYQVLDTSDVPGGVVNILTGNHAELAAPMASHLDVDAVWSFSSTDLAADIEHAAAGNLKRTWVNNATARDWLSTEGEGHAFLQAATEVKNIWVPYGE
ncbi:MAG: aldehyde dehydrogenase family protein [Shimia sp.]|jgi:aldehyde dehydrogenase (NAD+)|uniref:aldehyde dehydrogenase family protein n=1 Tax=Shimia sp. TaxID=1954381 RepID=UPI0040594F5F